MQIVGLGAVKMGSRNKSAKSNTKGVGNGNFCLRLCYSNNFLGFDFGHGECVFMKLFI